MKTWTTHNQVHVLLYFCLFVFCVLHKEKISLPEFAVVLPEVPGKTCSPLKD